MDNYDWINLKLKYKWDNKYCEKFSDYLKNSYEALNEIKKWLEAGLIESTGAKLQEMYINAAKHTLNKNTKSKNTRGIPKNGLIKSVKLVNLAERNTKTHAIHSYKKNLKTNTGSTKQTQGVQNKHREYKTDTGSTKQTQGVQNQHREYKRKCQSNRYKFWQTKFNLIEKSLNNP